MKAIIYQCRQEGMRRDPEAIKRSPARGELIVIRRGYNNRTAMLLAPDGETYVVPVLDKVRILAVNGRGIMLSGIEVYPPRGSKGSGTRFVQSWWCVLRDIQETTLGR